VERNVKEGGGQNRGNGDNTKPRRRKNIRRRARGPPNIGQQKDRLPKEFGTKTVFAPAG